MSERSRSNSYLIIDCYLLYAKQPLGSLTSITAIMVAFHVSAGLQTEDTSSQGGRTILLAFGHFRIGELLHVVKGITLGSLALHLTHGAVMSGHTALGVLAKIPSCFYGTSVLGCSTGLRQYVPFLKIPPAMLEKSQQLIMVLYPIGFAS